MRFALRLTRRPWVPCAIENLRTIEPAQRLAAEALAVAHRLRERVKVHYGLIPDEVALIWATAPPRMPFLITPFDQLK